MTTAKRLCAITIALLPACEASLDGRSTVRDSDGARQSSDEAADTDAAAVDRSPDEAFVAIDATGSTTDLPAAPATVPQTDADERLEGSPGSEPSGAEVSTRMGDVWGKDERVRIAAMQAYPMRTIGMFSNGCTGTLVGPRHVLTAAHCVYDPQAKAWRQDVRFLPARNGAELPHGAFDSERVDLSRAWLDRGDLRHDYALVILRERIGDRLGWLGMHAGTTAELGDSHVSIVAYPSDKPVGTAWGSRCPIAGVQIDQLLYACDTAKGMSGGALYDLRPDTNQVLGIHSHADLDRKVNVGTRITIGLLRHLSQVIKADTVQSPAADE